MHAHAPLGLVAAKKLFAIRPQMLPEVSSKFEFTDQYSKVAGMVEGTRAWCQKQLLYQVNVLAVLLEAVCIKDILPT